MSKSRAPYLYKETRLNLEPTQPRSTIAITLPSTSVTSFLSRNQPKRIVVKRTYTDIDEPTFTKRHIGSEASLYFRSVGSYPRCFLWRVLEDRKCLEVRAVDIERPTSREGHNADLTLLLRFPASIKPFGIAFAEPTDRDALTVFVISSTYELYTITLQKQFFIQPQATELDVNEWCQISKPASFGFRYPYRIVARNAFELWVSLHDGGLLQLQRKPGDDGSAWRETFFADSGWSASIRGLIPWKGHSTVRFGDVDLLASSIAAVAVSPDEKFLYTVQLNHTIKAWDLISGKLVFERDLLGENLKEVQRAGQYLLGASQPQLVQIVERPRHSQLGAYHVVTFSPKQHRFKIWAINDPDYVDENFEDVHAECSLTPPIDELMNTTVWNLEEFHIDASAGWEDAQIWIRARSGPSSQVYTLRFSLLDSAQGLNAAWRNGWVAVDPGSLTVENLKHAIDYPGGVDVKDTNLHLSDYNERWLGFLLAPGRFTAATLEAALAMLKAGLKQKTPLRNGSEASLPLKNRLIDVITYSVVRQRTADHTNDDQHELETYARWQAFYGLARDLHKRRGEHLSLAFDHGTGLAWMALADHVAPLRASSEIELLSDNDVLLEDDEIDQLPDMLADSFQSDLSPIIARLFSAARNFRRGLSPEFNILLRHTVDAEVLEDPWASIATRLDAFDAKCELDTYITEESLRELNHALVHSVRYRQLTDAFWSETLRRFSERQHGSFAKNKYITTTGVDLLIRTSKETLQLQTETLLDLLLLTVVVGVYPDYPDPGYDVNTLFIDILEHLRHHSFLLWLTGNTISLPCKPVESTAGLTATHQPENQPMITRSLQEVIYKNDVFNVKLPDISMANKITYWARVWIFGAVKNDWELEAIPADVMGMLISARQWHTALQFRRFLSPSPWSAYLDGRLQIGCGEYSLAARSFKAASFGLSVRLVNEETFDRYEVVPLEERRLFHDGLSSYYQHVLGLFEKAKSYSYVAEFAELALQHYTGSATEEKSEDIRTDILSRLFTASVEISRFDDAYSAVSRSANPQLRAAHLTRLVTTMVARKQSNALLTLPFSALADEVDAVLEKECRKVLNLNTNPPYHKILYAYRTSRNDFRGAASILYERLQRLRASSATSDDAVVQCYLVIISTLTSVDPDQAWIFSESLAMEDSSVFGNGPRLSQGRHSAKRKMVTLDSIRKEYQQELDRQSDLENGRFAFTTNGEAVDFS